MISKIIAWITSSVSILGVFLSLSFKPAIGFILFAIVLTIIFLLIVIDLVYYFKKRPKRYKGKNKKEKINKYMFDWISNGGKVAIFSRDLSWADSTKEMKEMLIKKAQRNELMIVIPKEIPLTNELKKNGAEIIIYDYIYFTPKSRFTIIHKDKDYSSVAIANGVKNKIHIIEEFSNREHPMFSVSDDLINIIKETNKYIHEIKIKK